ncbi:MAG: hypothetical protein K2W93_21020 [Burkholderiaceae bacterium]|uniref:hypothetical protein n=1 Tax=Paucibacter sp. KCTC 42545 TaxID=1768242 RepID=UPI000733A650|nr:hypothetical protein [Paucibacter sp. KCTC 42545]ALT77489.1 hypothetical protein AT984_10105 [Paucibacter sp. KCTC 42545]MBY0237474.1 hypothetical protein [Burkholderiaceae bacterium]
MQVSRLLAALLLTSATQAFAADPSYLLVDHSNASLMDKTTAQEVWASKGPAKFYKFYPVKKWGFATDVEGGFDADKNCIITARTTMLPRGVKVDTLVLRPAKSATTFGVQANATVEQCKALAKAKLSDSMDAVRTALLHD